MEHQRLCAQGNRSLIGSKYKWLTGKNKLEKDDKQILAGLLNVAKKTARAWSIKEVARGLWDYDSKTWALKAWRRWYLRAVKSRLEPVKKVAQMIWARITGIINAITLKITNAQAEAVNGRIQMLKKRAAGFRNRDRFRSAILFHVGGLNLYPENPAI